MQRRDPHPEENQIDKSINQSTKEDLKCLAK